MPTSSATPATRTESLSLTAGTVLPSKVDMAAAIAFLNQFPERVARPEVKLTSKGKVMLTWGPPDCGAEMEFYRGKVALFQAAGVGKCPTALLTVDIPLEALTPEWVEEALEFFRE